MVLISSSFCYGQDGDVKLGKIDKKWLEMSVYEPDTSASAVILSDVGFWTDQIFQFSRTEYYQKK